MSKPLILYDNVFTASTNLVATDTDTGFNVANIIDLRPYTLWKSNSTGTKYITINAGSSVNADAIGIIGHNLFSADTTIAIEYSSSTSGPWSTALEGFTPSDDKAFVSTFSETSAEVWRIRIETASTQVYIGVACLGTALSFEKSPTFGFDPIPEGIASERGRALKGQLLGSVINFKPIEITPTFRGLTRSWLFGTFKSTVYDDHISELKPFFWSFNTTDAYQSDAMFVNVTEDYEFSAALTEAGTSHIEEFSLKMEGIKEE